MFFAELSVTGGVFSTPITTTTFAAATALTIAPSVLPPIPLGSGNFVSVGNSGTANFYILAKYSGTTGATGMSATALPAMTASQALALDGKLDDGVPSTGIVFSVGTAAGSTPPDPTNEGTAAKTNGAATGSVVTTSGNGTCWDSTLSQYAAANLNNAACNLAIRTSF